MDPGSVEAFLKTIDCYVMGSRTYETALSFEAKGLGWPTGAAWSRFATRCEGGRWQGADMLAAAARVLAGERDGHGGCVRDVGASCVF